MEKVKIEIYLPEEYIEIVIRNLNEIGACRIGNYDHVSSYSKVYGYWRPLNGSKPIAGEKEKINHGQECKLEVICPLEIARKAVDVIKEYHPYELPVINIIPLLEI